MVSKTMFLTGLMSMESKAKKILQAKADLEMQSIHIVGQDFSFDDGITKDLSHLFLLADRQWNTVKLSCCRGRVDLVLQAVLLSNVRRLILSPEERPPKFWSVLSQGLARNTSLVTLGLNDMSLQPTHLHLLCKGMQRNSSIMELSFAESQFHNNAHLALTSQQCFGLSMWKSLQHLSFQNCRLADTECSDLLLSMKSCENLIELSMDGNQCCSKGMKALTELLPTSNLLVLDLSSQKLDPNEHVDLVDFSKALPKSKLRCLQMSDNSFDENSLQSFARGLSKNSSLHSLQMAWCSLPSLFMRELGKALCSNSTLSRLILYESGIDDKGIVQFSLLLHDMKGLKKLDIGGKQAIGSLGIEGLCRGIQRNTVLENILVKIPYGQISVSERLEYYCDLNRAGRRFLQFSQSSVFSALALWGFRELSELEA